MSDRRKNAMATFERWVSDEESWIGIFENHAMDSISFGSRFAMVFDDSITAEIGNKAPDVNLSPIDGIGWKWCLIEKTKSAEMAVNLIFGEIQ